MLAPGGVAFVSTPNLLTLAPPGAEKSDNPWHVHEYRAEEFRELCEGHFPRVELYGLFHARKLRAHELAIKLGWDRVPNPSAEPRETAEPAEPGGWGTAVDGPGGRPSEARPDGWPPPNPPVEQACGQKAEHPSALRAQRPDPSPDQAPEPAPIG